MPPSTRGPAARSPAPAPTPRARRQALAPARPRPSASFHSRASQENRNSVFPRESKLRVGGHQGGMGASSGAALSARESRTRLRTVSRSQGVTSPRMWVSSSSAENTERCSSGNTCRRAPPPLRPASLRAPRAAAEAEAFARFPTGRLSILQGALVSLNRGGAPKRRDPEGLLREETLRVS